MPQIQQKGREVVSPRCIGTSYAPKNKGGEYFLSQRRYRNPLCLYKITHQNIFFIKHYFQMVLCFLLEASNVIVTLKLKTTPAGSSTLHEIVRCSLFMNGQGRFLSLHTIQWGSLAPFSRQTSYVQLAISHNFVVT